MSKHTAIPGWPGYSISRDGEVISAVRGPVRVLKPYLDRDGYACLRINRDGKRTHAFVHHLVLLAFVGPKPDDADLCRHLNDVKTDNRVENLAWGTYSENLYDAVHAGTANSLRRGEDKGGVTKLTETQVREIERRARGGESERSVARAFGISHRQVHTIKHHRNWVHLWPEAA